MTNFTTSNVELVSDINNLPGAIYRYEESLYWIAKEDLHYCGNAFIRGLTWVQDEPPIDPPLNDLHANLAAAIITLLAKVIINSAGIEDARCGVRAACMAVKFWGEKPQNW